MYEGGDEPGSNKAINADEGEIVKISDEKQVSK
jgi:hypothetical protein